MQAEEARIFGPGVEHRARRRLRSFRRSWKALIGGTILLVVVLAATLAPYVSPYNPLDQRILDRLKPPAFAGGTRAYPLGTDPIGRDVLSRIIHGSRVSLAVGLSAVLIGGSLGLTLGLLSGYYGARLDMVIMRIADLQLAIPFLVLAIAIITVLQPGLLSIVLVLGLSSWVTYARVARGQVLSVRGRDFVEASRAMGGSEWRVMLRHVLPNIIAPVIVVATLEVGRMILAEAALSFLGLGIQPPAPTWGGITADGRDYLGTAWWISTLPGIAILLTVMAINFVGDWLRDVLDPTVIL
ncbi:MAG: ABC transporter permease [Armatimonadetes bacterium]|nr:ABC transporter permease [Armatimonadota bacterium]